MGLRNRMFDTDRGAIRLPNLDLGSKAVEVSATMLGGIIDLGSAGPDGLNRGRLATLFARGYLFGFAECCVQGFGVFGEIEALALITVVHTKIFGGQVGWLLVQDALRQQGQTDFLRGQTAGGEDFQRWLNERSHAPRSLAAYLVADDEASGPKGTFSVSVAQALITPTSAASELTVPSSLLWH